MKLIMFDIDGTLTLTNEADEGCFVQALQEVFGLEEINTDWASYPHCSDSAILEVLFQTQRGRSPEPADVASFQSHFVALLTRSTAAQPFGPVSGAREFLDELIANAEFAVSLASGGWECSARLKLASAGLDLASRFPAAFADDGHSREAIMQASLRRAAQACSRDSFDAVIYVGDGVWDARASRNLGYGFIGIARERARADRLYAEGAQHVFADYRDADSIMAVLHKSGPASPA